jgi:PAS domain S-box-containing protein
MDPTVAKRLGKKRHQEEVFKASASCYCQLAELCPEALFIQSEGKFVWLNQAAVRLYGAANPQELVGQSVFDFVHPEYRDLVEAQIRSVQEQNEVSAVDQKWLRLDGTILNVAVTLLPCFYQGKSAAQVILRNQGDRDLKPKVEPQTVQLVGVNERLESEIAERQKVEAALHRSEQLLSDFFENAIVGMHWIGADGYILRVNQAQLDLLGYTREEYLGHPFAKFFVDPATIKDILQRLLNRTVLHQYEAQLRCKDGSVKSVAISSNVLWEGDKFVHTRCVVHDMTQRRQAEAALQKKERQLKALLNNIPDIAWLKDRDSRFIAVNEPFSKACGVRSEDLVGKTDADVWTPVLAQKYRDNDAEVIASGEQKRFEEPLAHSSGQIAWIETIKTPIYNDLGDVIGTTGIARDITQRRQLEIALRQSEQRLCLALSATETGIWEWDIPTDRTFWSDTVFRLLGREPGSCESNYQNWLAAIHPEDRERADRCTRQAGASGSGLNLEYRVVLPDQTVRWLTCVGGITHSIQGEPAKMAGITADITDRVRMETKRQQIEAALRELTQQLQQQNAQLAEVSRIKSEFLANMSHELRTPLTSILGFSTVLLQQHFGHLTEKQEQYLSRIHDSGEHLLALINDLLDLAKIEAGRLELNLEKVSLTELCEAALQIVEVRALAKRQHLSLELPIASEQVTVDRQRILQILLNYLSNAIKFTPEGGTITLCTHLASRSEVETQDPLGERDRPLQPALTSQFVVLSVRDTGIGVPVEKHHLLFQMFQQVDGALDRAHQGTGLGLALTKRLVELHGGKVSVTSAPNQGSTFSAWLPLLK